jgi:hypothetical protein
LIRGFLDDLRHRPDIAPQGRTLAELRDDGLLTLYRLLFILYAESRDEKLQTHSLYKNNYSLESLVGGLLHKDLADIPANRFGHWERLLALFRIYDEGMPPVPGLHNIPPRGGTLFSDKTPSGAFLSRVQLPDRLVAQLLLTLATTRPRRGVGRERVSYRELDIRQLGSVYEGLLEYEPRTADGTMIEVKVQGKLFALSPSELARLCQMKQLHLVGDTAIVEQTEAATLHPELTEEDDADETDEDDESESDTDAEGDEDDEEKGVKRGAHAKLIRRLEQGDFYFVPGAARKSSGSYYTRDEIVNYLVEQSLKDLVDGKSAAEIESLRIIDPACGSAHFLVGAARYLAPKLLQAYRRELKSQPPAEFSPQLIAAQRRLNWEKEGEAWCKRRIVEKCLFGVDYNPTAVQLAQVALWIESLAGDRPLSFFEHHIRCGNSLLGTWLDALHIPPHPDLEPTFRRDQLGLFEHRLKNSIQQAATERLTIDSPAEASVRKDTPQEYEYKAGCLQRAHALLEQAELLFDLRNAAAFVPAIWRDWIPLVSADNLAAFARTRPWWNEFVAVKNRERFFHWELEFPEVFRGQKKGFDAVLGNPPWEKVKPDRKEFYGRADILIRAYTGGELDTRIRELQAAAPELTADFKSYEERVKTLAASLKGGGDYRFCDWEINGKSTGGDPDLFKFFVERAHQILRARGRLAFLVPSALYNNEGCTGLRHLLLDQSNVIAFYGFENRHKIFPIDSRYKFVCLVLEKLAAARGETEELEFRAAFMRHELAELQHSPPRNVQVLIKRSELQRLSPGTLAFLEYRSERDRQIILKMYGLLPNMTPRPLLGDQGDGAWNAKFYTEFHMTNDRDLWTKPNGQLWTPKEICGLNFPADPEIPFSEVRAAMAKEGFWPLYEGKHIEQFLVDIKPIERWVSLEKHQAKFGRQPVASEKVVMRAIASNTNERTCISAVIPDRSCFGHSLYGYEGSACKDVAVALLNSLASDFTLRHRVSSNVSPTYLKTIPSITLRENALPKTQQSKSEIHIDQIVDLWTAVWTSNRNIAQAYGLTADDFAHILTTFPVFARKRPAFYKYLQERVAEWKASEQ